MTVLQGVGVTVNVTQWRVSTLLMGPVRDSIFHPFCVSNRCTPARSARPTVVPASCVRRSYALLRRCKLRHYQQTGIVHSMSARRTKAARHCRFKYTLTLLDRSEMARTILIVLLACKLQYARG